MGVSMGVSGGGGGGGGSLRDVLLGSGGPHGGGTSSRGTASHRGALTWRSLRSVSGTVDAVDPRGHFFPAKLALALGILKLLMALFMVTLGALALVLQAALSPLGAGLWAGAVVGVSGFLGVCASRRPYAHVYVVSFMCVAILSMASSGLLVVLSATAWARDDQHPTAVFIEQETQEEVTVLGEVLMRRPAVMVSGALVLLGVLDCLVSLACAAISAREACGLYSKGEERAHGLSEGQNRKERLYRWLGQQKTIFPIGSSHGPPRGVSSVSQFVPLTSSDSSSSAIPRRSSGDPSRESSIPSSSSHRRQVLSSSGASSEKTNSTRVTPPSVPSILKPSSLHSTHGGGAQSLPLSSHRSKHLPSKPVPQLHSPPPAGHLSMPPRLHMHPHMHPHVHPHHMPHYPTHAAHPSLYYPHLVTPMMPYYPTDQELQHQARKHKKKESKRRKEKEAKKEKKKHKRSKRELTDEQIDRTYTGLDRELAEEFIDSTMEPGLSLQRAFNTSFEQESF